MPNHTQFMDCPSCGKRILTTASACHHCGNVPRHLQYSNSYAGDTLDEPYDESPDGHMAFSAGGYDDDDDFDYNEFMRREMPNTLDDSRPQGTPLWVWLTAWVIILSMAFAALVTFFQAF